LFGETEKGRIAASYGSVNCPIPLSVRLHAKVIVYGALQLPEISRVFRQWMQRLRIWLP
jgi:hypothetical protein